MSASREMLEKARAARRAGDLSGAGSLAEQAAEIAREESSPATRASALNFRAQVLCDQGSHESALAFYEESLELVPGHRDKHLEAHTLRHMAECLRSLGETRRALVMMQTSLGLYRSLDGLSSLEMANVLRSCALINEEMENPDAARAFWRETLRLYTLAGMDPGAEEASARLAGLQPD